MQKVTIKAYNGKGESKEFAGEKEVNRPTTVDEAVEMFGSERVLKGFWASEAIHVQNQIRTGTGHSPRAKLNTLVEEARRQKATGDSRVYDRLVALELIKE